MADRRIFATALLLALFALETVVFYGQLTSQITPFYARAIDQVAYLITSFDLLQRTYQGGLWTLWNEIYSPTNLTRATSASFATQGALMALIGGPTRAAVVSLNLIYFLALQVMIFSTIAKKTARIDLAWLALALLITMPTLFHVAGGMFDFRMDFGALCLFGIWVCAVLRTDGFRDLKWSVIAGLCAGFLVSTRYITAVYIVAIGAMMMFALTILAFRSRDGTRLKNFIVSSLVFAAIVAPIFYISRKAIYGYYGIGHVVGPEKYIRAAEMGLASLADHIAFYPVDITTQHLGLFFFVLTAAILLLAVISRSREPQANAPRPLFDIAFLVLCVMVPLAILTIMMAKSPVVGGIVVVPMVLLVVTLASVPRWTAGPFANWLVATAVVCGLFVFVSHANIYHHHGSREDLRTVTRLNAAAANYISANSLAAPRIAGDRIQDFLNFSTIWLAAQEQDPRRKTTRPVASISIFAVSRERAMEALTRSDIAILSDNSPRGDAYPFNKSMAEHWPAMNDYALNNMSLLDEGRIFGIHVRVFVQPRK